MPDVGSVFAAAEKAEDIAGRRSLFWFGGVNGIAGRPLKTFPFKDVFD